MYIYTSIFIHCQHPQSTRSFYNSTHSFTTDHPSPVRALPMGGSARRLEHVNSLHLGRASDLELQAGYAPVSCGAAGGMRCDEWPIWLYPMIISDANKTDMVISR